MLLGIDTGGTYTDAVVYDEVAGVVLAKAKSPTTHHDLAIGICAAIDAVLRAAGASLTGVVSVTVFMADLAEFAAMNAIFARRFGEHRPARSTVQVAALPIGARVEIAAIARIGA